ncbi:MAG: TonB-dependent receptor [Halioglobus sp.]
MTARKREESLMDIPQSVTAISAKTVENAGLTEMTDLGHFLPNVNLTVRSDNEPNVVIRGIGAFGNTQGVGFYMDDAQQFLDQSTLFSEVERIEVIKGPVGTLYGGSNIGGAIKYVMIEPGEEFGGYAYVEGGSFDTARVMAAMDIPLIDGKLYARVSAYGYETDGHLHDRFRDTDVNTREETGARLSLRWDVSEQFTVLNRFRYVTMEDGGFFQLQRPHSLDDFIDYTEFNERPFMERDVWSNVLKMDWDLEAGMITSVTSYSERDVPDYLFDLDYSPAPLLVGMAGNIDTEASTASQELRFTSDYDGSFNYIAGLYYTKIEDNLFQQNMDISVGGFLISPFVDIDIEDTQYAAFFSGEYAVGDFELGFGVRLNRAEQDVDLRTTNPQFSDDISNTEVLPKLSLSYHMSDDLMVYGSYAKGYEPAGFNLVGDTAGETFDAESVDALELGVKGSIMDGRGNLTLAGFYNDYVDRQFEDTILSSDGNVSEVIRNIGDTITYGLEVEFNYLMTEFVTVGAAAGWTKAEWEDGAIFNSEPVDGLTPPNTPEFSGTAFADASWPVLNDAYQLNARLDYSYQGSRYWDIENTSKSSSYNLLNMRIGFASADERWELAVSGQNLLDEEYWTEAFPNIQGNPADSEDGLCGGFGCHLALLGKPRSYMASLRYNF